MNLFELRGILPDIPEIDESDFSAKLLTHDILGSITDSFTCLFEGYKEIKKEIDTGSKNERGFTDVELRI